MRGGGAGSWGVIVSTTFRTFPTFDAVRHSAVVVVNNTDQVAQLTTLHAKHIFDPDDLHPGQYFSWSPTSPNFTLSVNTYFPNATITDAMVALAPFFDGVTALGITPTISSQLMDINDLVGASTADPGGFNAIIGSRLFPSPTYENNATEIGQVTKQLLDEGAAQ